MPYFSMQHIRTFIITCKHNLFLATKNEFFKKGEWYSLHLLCQTYVIGNTIKLGNNSVLHLFNITSFQKIKFTDYLKDTINIAGTNFSEHHQTC